MSCRTPTCVYLTYFTLLKKKQAQQIYIKIVINSPVNKTSAIFYFLISIIILLTDLKLCLYWGCWLVASSELWVAVPLTTFPFPLLACLRSLCSAGWGWFKCLKRFIVAGMFIVVGGLLWWTLCLHSQWGAAMLMTC